MMRAPRLLVPVPRLGALALGAAWALGFGGCGSEQGTEGSAFVADGEAEAWVDDVLASLPAGAPYDRTVHDFDVVSGDDQGELRDGDVGFAGIDTGTVSLRTPQECEERAPASCRSLGTAAHLAIRNAAEVRFATPRRVLGLHAALQGRDVPALEALEPMRNDGFAFMLPQLRLLVTALDADGSEGATIRAIPASATFRSTDVERGWLWVDTHRLGEVFGIRLVVESPLEGVHTVLIDNLVTSRDYAPDRDFFAIALIPDTQKYVETAELQGIFHAQTRWIAQNREVAQIAFASHLGDIVEQGHVEAEWRVADLAMAALDGVIPYGIVIGNHDFEDWEAPERGSPLFGEYFPESRFAEEPWWGGRAPDDLSSYQVFDTPEGPFLYLHLSVDAPPPTVDWAASILAEHPGVPTAITTHVYLRENGRIPVSYMSATAPSWPGISADALFEELVAKHDQIFLVTCGHIAAEHLQVSLNDSNHAVYEMLQDYQNRIDGGEGFLRLLEMYPRRSEIRAVTYSPHLDTYEVDEDSHFTIEGARVPGWGRR